MERFPVPVVTSSSSTRLLRRLALDDKRFDEAWVQDCEFRKNWPLSFRKICPLLKGRQTWLKT